MPRKPVLHAADDLLAPAVEATVTAVGPPDDDAALVALARVLAGSLDRMSNDERARMLGQTAPALLKVLVELDRRAARRGEPAQPAAPNWLDAMRESRARAEARRISRA